MALFVLKLGMGNAIFYVMKPKKVFLFFFQNLVDLDIILEIMKVPFWKMCNAKECTELKMSIFFKSGPYLENVAMQEKNALNLN